MFFLHSIAIEPSFVADTDESEPRKPPIGVRAIPTMQTSAKKKQNKQKMKVKENRDGLKLKEPTSRFDRF